MTTNEAALYLALGDVGLNPVDLVDDGKIGFLLLRDAVGMKARGSP